MRAISRQLNETSLLLFLNFNGLIATGLILIPITGCDQLQSTSSKQVPQSRPLARPSALPEIPTATSDFRIQILQAELTRRNSHSLQVDLRYLFENGKPETGRKYRFLLDFPGTAFTASFDLDAADLHAAELTFLVADPSKASGEKLKPPADYNLTILAGARKQNEIVFVTCSNSMEGQFAASIYD